MKSLFIALISMLTISQAHAIRHVGSGGGEAELLLWNYVHFFPYWAQGCNTNPELCWNGGVVSTKVQQKIKNLKLEFVNQSDLIERCEQDRLILTHEELYVAPAYTTSKSKNDLATILLKNILLCQGVNIAQVETLKITTLPEGRQLHSVGIASLTGPETDIVFLINSDRNIHAEVVQKTKCTQYRATPVDNKSFNIRCLENQNNFLATPQQVDSELILNIRYDSELEF